MELVEFTGDVEVIQKLGTFPNAEDGLTAEDLKKKFDEAPTAIKKYLNETLVPEVNRIGKNAGKPISVTITTVDGALTADKGYAELFAAHTAGQTVHCKLPDGSVLALAGADESGLLFQGENGRDYQQIIIGADGTITYKSGKYALLGELVTDATIGVYPSGDGYESTDTLEDLQESAKAGRTIVCNLEVGDGELLRLPMTKREDDAFHFSAVFEGKEYMVTINADGVTVEQSEVGSGGNVDQGGLTKAQIAALDGMFKVCAYDGNPADAYLAFKTAFGIADTEETIPCTNISLNVNTLEFTNNEPLTLTATVEPSDTTDVVVWKSSNASIATVKNGVVTPIANGNCTITATCGEKQAVCSVSIDMGEIVMYSVTNTLSYVTNDNSNASVQEGSSYTANLTPYDSYTLVDVTVTMGGVDITSTVYSNGVITIPSVTGNIVIVANAIGGSYVPGEGTAIGYTKGYALEKDGIVYEYALASVSDFIDYEASSEDRQVTVYGCCQNTCSYNNGVLVDYWQTSPQSPVVKKFANANSNQLRFSIDNAYIDVAYAYFTATGEVLFAMKNSEYYGKTNIND